ncbi:MAG: hypothetical protein JWR16_978 [Nevskia sp.]|nr:hypothetical protein [Nevskia sp.]
MTENAKASRNAIAAALTRVIADGFMLRFQTEALLWNLDQTDRTRAAILQRSQSFLDELILKAALRIQMLGGRSPQSLQQLGALSSLSDSVDPGSGSAALAHLALAYAALSRGCRMVAMIAHADGDEITEHLLRVRLVPLEDILSRLDQLARQE